MELVPACQRLDVGLLPYFPLAYGLLTGKYRRGEDAPSGTRLAAQSERLAGADWERIEALQTFADERDLTLLQVAMGGLAAQDAVTSVIAGATRPEQVRANADAVGWLPSEDDLAALSEIGAAHQSYTTFAPA